MLVGFLIINLIKTFVRIYSEQQSLFSVVFYHRTDQMSSNAIFFDASMTIQFFESNHVLGRLLNSPISHVHLTDSQNS